MKLLYILEEGNEGVSLTWHDDIREAQFPGDGHAPGEEDHVLPPQLLYVSVEELESHC